jgi:hypothetical protein
VLALAVAALALLPATAHGARPLMKPRGPLSPALVALAKPSVRALSLERQAQVMGIAPSGPGSLLRDDGLVLVRVRFDHGAVDSGDAVRASGAQVLSASRRYQTATVAVAPAELSALAAVPTVAAVTPARAPLLYASCEGGSVISEGVAQLNADEVKANGIDGTGTAVGVLSDSYDEATEAATGASIATHAQEDIESEDLPGVANECTGQKTAINVLQDFPSESATDEGRGMLQIVHDMAPKAVLSFATAFISEEVFASNIEKLATAGAKVIVDDVAYFEEPFFQDGPVAAAINKVTASKGVTYFSAAGNDNLFDAEGNEFASWEAPAYRDSGGCPVEVAAIAELRGSHCMDFNPGAATDRTYGIKVEPGALLSIDLQWAEPWEGVETDLDAILLNSTGAPIAGSAENNLGTQRPLEIVQWINESGSTKTVQLVINRFSGPGARLKFILMQNGGGVSGVEYPESGGGDVVGPSVMGHAGAASAIAVAAVPFNNSGKPEPYSSRGPVTHYFEAVKGGPVPADPIPGGEVISKPDVTATDCGGTTFFAFFSGGEWHFCGTSAAAPHAAGAVALMRQAAPLASTALLRESLAGTASPIGAFDSCAVGGGLVETVAAVKAAKGETTPVAPDPCEPPNASGAVFVAPGDWGSEGAAPAQPSQPTTPQPPPPTPPNTSFAKHPKKTVRIRGRSVKLVFRFSADQSGVTFLCKVDGTGFRACGAKLARPFKPGKHVVRVKARNAAGLVDPSPAVFRFRVERVS